MRIVVDTNCLLASVPRKSQYRWLYDAILNGQVQLVVTTEILAEYEEQLGLFYAPDYAEFVLIALLNLPSLMRINPLSFYWLLIENDLGLWMLPSLPMQIHYFQRQALPHFAGNPLSASKLCAISRL